MTSILSTLKLLLSDGRKLVIELGKIAYNAYGDNRGWVTFNGDAMPTWEEQTPELREAWDAAAQAVAAELIPS